MCTGRQCAQTVEIVQHALGIAAKGKSCLLPVLALSLSCLRAGSLLVDRVLQKFQCKLSYGVHAFMVCVLQMNEAHMLDRNALHALMGLEATPIKAGGFKYIHRDTGMIFEIAPATPDSAGQAYFTSSCVTCVTSKACTDVQHRTAHACSANSLTAAGNKTCHGHDMLTDLCCFTFSPLTSNGTLLYIVQHCTHVVSCTLALCAPTHCIVPSCRSGERCRQWGARAVLQPSVARQGCRDAACLFAV